MSISSGISSITVLGSGAMSSADAGSSNVSGSLGLNSGYSENGDSYNVWLRTCIWSSSAGRSVLVEVDSGDSGTGGYVTMSAGILSGGDGGLLNLN